MGTYIECRLCLWIDVGQLLPNLGFDLVHPLIRPLNYEITA